MPLVILKTGSPNTTGEPYDHERRDEGPHAFKRIPFYTLSSLVKVRTHNKTAPYLTRRRPGDHCRINILQRARSVKGKIRRFHHWWRLAGSNR